jgi:hypothetical protein
MNESEFKQFIAKIVVEALMKNFPEETRQVIEKLD